MLLRSSEEPEDTEKRRKELDKAIMKIVDRVVAAARTRSAEGGHWRILVHDNEDGTGPAAIVGTLAWALLAENRQQVNLDQAPEPEEEHCKKQLKRLLRAVDETLHSTWARAAAAAATPSANK